LNLKHPWKRQVK